MKLLNRDKGRLYYKAAQEEANPAIKRDAYRRPLILR